MSKTELLSYFCYFLLSILLLSTQWYWGLSPRIYVEPILEPLYDIYEISSKTANESLLFLNSRKALINRLEEANRENRRLKRKVYQGKAAKRENAELREYLDLPNATEFSLLPAEVLANHLSGWERTFRINQGSSNGLKTDQLALDIRGDTWVVRGEVFSTSRDHSVVVLSSDPRFKIGVRIEGILGRQFVARGWGFSGLRIENFPPFLNVPSGASVYTASDSVIAPEDLYLGKVKNVQKKSKNQVGRRIQISPPELSNRNLVWIVTQHE